jgi:isocitrate/isopropylmalate dehydrogenase
MFVPVHGFVANTLGNDIAKPIGVIMEGTMMIEYLGKITAANAIGRSIGRMTDEGTTLPHDLGSKASSKDVVELISSY